MKDEAVPALNAIISAIRRNAPAVKHTSVEPSTDNVGEGQLVIYDNGSGTKRIYVVTGKKNLGYITLT